MIDQIDLVGALNRHLEQTGEAPAAFGRRIAKDPSLVSELREGRNVGIALANKIIAAINAGSAPTESISTNQET